MNTFLSKVVLLIFITFGTCFDVFAECLDEKPVVFAPIGVVKEVCIRGTTIKRIKHSGLFSIEV
jgi:hypothetical protein